MPRFKTTGAAGRTARAGLAAAALLLTNGAGNTEAAPPARPDDARREYAALPGPALVQQLLEAGTRPRAFYELCRRARILKSFDYEAFLAEHHDPEVVVCPQGADRPPIYAVLYDFLYWFSLARDEDYETPDPAGLFPPAAGGDAARKHPSLAIEVFAADGRRLDIFGGNNCLMSGDVMADINGDGLVERADDEAYGVDDVASVDVLRVCVVAPEMRPLLAVLYNWGEAEWGYRFTDPDRDGILDVELGPKVPGGIATKVVYKWNRDRHAYEGPAGRAGDHFLRLDVNAELFAEFDRLKQAGLAFPKDPDFVDVSRADEGPWARQGRKKPSPKEVSKPYRRSSLRNLTDEETVRFMGTGKCMSELEDAIVLKTHAPANFWALDPKAAALAVADANRYPDHRKRFRLAVDDRDGRPPPDTGSLAFSYAAGGDIASVEGHYFLRIDPKRSYLACAHSCWGGEDDLNFVHDQPAFDFRLCELPYEEARHLARTVWWLDRVRSLGAEAPDGSSDSSSSTDGDGSLTLRDGGGEVAVQLGGSLWADPVSARWRHDYDRATCLNLAFHLVATALPEHLGERWSRFEPAYSRSLQARWRGAPQYETDERQRLGAVTETFLDLFSPDQTSLSFAIVRAAVQAAGGFAYTNLAAKLTDVTTRLPTVRDTKHAQRAIEAQIARLDRVRPDSPGASLAWKKKEALRRELASLRSDTRAEDVRNLADGIALSLQKLRGADDVPALQTWATSKKPGARWALQRLQTKDRKRYVAALEWWMQHAKDDFWASRAFDAIAREDSPRAAELARQTRPDRKGFLAVSAFAHLAKVDGIPDEAKRVRTLIRIALDRASYESIRSRALELLVPADHPLRYPTREIDDALAKLLTPEMADQLLNFTLGCACRGLAQRGRTEYFERMAQMLDRAPEAMTYEVVLGAATQLAQLDPAACNPRLAAILRPELKHTNKSVPELLMSAWAADLRDLKPELEALATSGPDDCEDERAQSYGGEASDAEGRFHLARQIVALWNEDDPATRCRLLLAFGLTAEHDFVNEPKPEQLARMKSDLAAAARALAPEQREQVRKFLDWYQTEHIDREKEPSRRESRAQFVALAKGLLSLQ